MGERMSIEKQKTQIEIETEYKALISKEKFIQLKEYFSQFTKVLPPYTQTNYYFDVKEYLFIKRGITIRIRNKKKKWILQIKVPDYSHLNSDYNKHQEINTNITEKEASFYIKNGFDKEDPYIYELFTLINAEPLTINMIGSLETKRHDYNFYTDTISLDENKYFDRIDYELEWETTNHHFVPFELKRLDVIPKSGVGKITRFFDRLHKK